MKPLEHAVPAFPVIDNKPSGILSAIKRAARWYIAATRAPLTEDEKLDVRS